MSEIKSYEIGTRGLDHDSPDNPVVFHKPTWTYRGTLAGAKLFATQQFADTPGNRIICIVEADTGEVVSYRWPDDDRWTAR